MNRLVCPDAKNKMDGVYKDGVYAGEVRGIGDSAGWKGAKDEWDTLEIWLPYELETDKRDKDGNPKGEGDILTRMWVELLNWPNRKACPKGWTSKRPKGI